MVLRRFLRRRSLAALTERAEVALRGKLAGEDIVVSPMTGRRGVLMEYRFWDRRVIAEDTFVHSGRTLEYSVPMVVGRTGASVLVDVAGALVHVPLASAVELRFRGPWDPGNLPNLLPDEYVRAHHELSDFREELRYDERLLCVDDPVELVGLVEPVETAAGGPYRGGGDTRWAFEARPDLGPLLIRERRA